MLGALFSRKKMSKTHLTQAGSSAKRATRAAQQRSDVQRAKSKLDDLLKRRKTLDEEFTREVAELDQSLSAANLVLEPMAIKPRKSDIAAENVVLVWTPWIVTPDGQARPGFSLTGEGSFF